MEPIYEGKAKILYPHDQDSDLLVQHFKNDATAFNGVKKAQITGKAECNCSISTLFFDHLHENGIKTHFREKISSTDMVIQKVTIIPLEVVVRFVAAGSIVKRLGIEEKTELTPPIVEFYYKKDELGDPLINQRHIMFLGVATPEDLDYLSAEALQIGQLVRERLEESDLTLVDLKLEFGRTSTGEIILADEISPDTCRIWDAKTDEKLDKDRFRFDLGDLVTGYQVILDRMTNHLRFQE